jgi:hypothetical protein
MNDLRNRSMLDFHPRVSETSYEIKGSAPLGVVEAFCREMGIVVQDFLVVEPDYAVILSFTDVFGSSFDGG